MTISTIIDSFKYKPEEAYEREGAVLQIFVIFGRVGRRKLGQFFVSRRGHHAERGAVKLPKHRSAK